MTVDLKKVYAARIAAGALAPDPAQERALAALQDLCARMAPVPPERRWWPRRAVLNTPRGLYLHGPVGRGKSMLMDLFFGHVPVPQKRRVHFHHFMQEIHAALHQRRQDKGHGIDPLPQIARDIAAESRLLCFDEFHVSDIADAMILGRLFTALFAAGLVLVATSNQAPDMLYRGGLQRQLFEPFIDVLSKHVEIVAVNGAVDHRMARLRGQEVFFTPLGPEATSRLAALFMMLTGEAEPQPAAIDVQGRQVSVPRAAKGVAWCDFAGLCGQALGAADYLAFVGEFHSLILDGVPQLQAEQRNEAVRFMTLIDVLYEAKVKLIMAAAAPPEQLYPHGRHAPEFQRAVSRLHEMRGAEYLALPHAGK